MIRKIKNGIISDDMKSSTKDITYCLYVLDHLKSVYILPLSNSTDQNSKETQCKKKTEGDKYIADIIKKHNITLDKLDRYKTEYISSIPLSIRKDIIKDTSGSDKEADESFDASFSDRHLPPLSRRASRLGKNINKTITSIEGYIS